jgi:hypothetical protein
VIERTQSAHNGLLDLLESPRSQLLLLLFFAFVYRMSTFGHPNMDSDEALYFYIGQEMHRGMIPYVDIWDRKPLGLFLIYYLIAAVSDSVIAYQIAAWLCVALTAWVIGLIVSELSSRRAGLMAGLCYVAALPLFFGWGGQAPIFYNPLVAGAAWMILKALPRLRDGGLDRRVDLAMFLCGVALTVKQTALVESAFFGIFCAFTLLQSGMPKGRVLKAAAWWMLLGVLPTLLICLYYWLSGHWTEFWQAMFLSNLAKQPATWVTLASRAINSYLRMLPFLCTFALGLVLKPDGPNAGKYRGFLIGWIVAAWIGFLIVPNLYPHYILPLIVPLCVASGLLFSRRDVGLVFFLIAFGTSVTRYNAFDFTRTSRAQTNLAALTQSIRQHDNGRGLFIYDGPILLYAMTGHRPMSPLALPLHLNYAVEENVSHIDTNAEVARILAARPGVVLVSKYSRNNPANEVTLGMVNRYIQVNCRLITEQWSSEMFRSDPILVYGDCAREPN